MMKRAIALLLAAMLTIFSLTACGISKTNGSSTNNGSSTTTANGSAENDSTVNSSTSAQRAKRDKDAEGSAEESAVSSDAASSEAAAGNSSAKKGWVYFLSRPRFPSDPRRREGLPGQSAGSQSPPCRRLMRPDGRTGKSRNPAAKNYNSVSSVAFLRRKW